MLEGRYSKQRFHDSVSRLRTKCFNYIADIYFVNRVSQFCFIFGLCGISNFGIFITLPYLYSGYGPDVVLFIRIVGSFLALQMVVNWLCMRFVDSGYNPDRDGTIPEGTELGEVINQVHENKEDSESKNGTESKDVRKRNVGSMMYVASEMPKTANEQPKRTAYPYFSWTPCLRCNRPRPPRCHHCPICKVCVLKRDHHCYFTGTCVGFRNLRHFVVFLFWASVATTFATLHAVPYYYYDVFQSSSFYDWVFPIAILRAACGYIEWKFALFFLLIWILCGFLYWALSFLKIVIDLIKIGKTTFEVDFKMNLTDKRCVKDKLRAVFGDYWIWNFIFPLHFVFQPIDDPVRWPYIKA